MQQVLSMNDGLLSLPFAAGGPWALDANTVVMIALILFLGLVYWKGWPLIRDMLDGQINTIKSELARAQQLREEAEVLLSEYEKKHRQAVGDSKAIVARAQEDAQVLRAKAEADLAEALKRREAAAKTRIVQAEAAAVAQAQAQAAAQAVAAAEKMLADKLDGEMDGKLIDEAIGLIPGRLA